jgi:hypothetical protein
VDSPLEEDGFELPVRRQRLHPERPADHSLAITYCESSGLGFVPKVRFALDSPLEGDGFEPSVPRQSETISTSVLRCCAAADEPVLTLWGAESCSPAAAGRWSPTAAELPRAESVASLSLIDDQDFIGDMSVAVEMVDDRYFRSCLDLRPSGRRRSDPEYRAVGCVID